jgi:Kef-type K+ transport system membrane component KefB/DNA-binding NarL/FixJ family response regulator
LSLVSDIFLDLALVLVLAAVFGVGATLLRQPPILGYVAAGVLASITGLIPFAERAPFEALSQIGVALLLFIVGLEMNIRDLKTVGKSAVITGVGQIVFTSVAGYFIVRALGFAVLPSVYLAVALTFSSTIIVVKLLTEKKDLSSLYGKIAVGFLLVQDFVAVVALMFLSGFAADSSLTNTELALFALKAVTLLGGVFLLSRYVFPKLVHRLARFPEILFVSSLAWALGLAALVGSRWFGFSIEIGGFLAGLALAGSVEHIQIGSRIRPLRDFFVTLFFVTLGFSLSLGSVGNLWGPALILSVFILLGNPIIVLILMGLLGFRRRTSFLSSITVAQISEFSLILVLLGWRLGHLPIEAVALTTMVGIITMVASTYMILHGEWLATRLDPLLRFFERSHPLERRDSLSSELSGHTVLVGCHRMGQEILKALLREKVSVVVVDFDPDIFDRLRPAKVPVVFGDISDPDVREAARIPKARMVLSTVGDIHDSLRMLASIKLLRRRPVVVLTAQDNDEAKRLYEAGADYVILPHFVSGEHIAHTLKHLHGPTDFRTLGRRHRATLTAS